MYIEKLGGSLLIFILSLLIIILDQVTKHYAIGILKGSKPHIIIPDFFRLVYVENFGAAFGILQNKRWIFIIITTVVILAIILFVIKNYYELNTFMKLGLIMLYSTNAIVRVTIPTIRIMILVIAPPRPKPKITLTSHTPKNFTIK